MCLDMRLPGNFSNKSLKYVILKNAKFQQALIQKQLANGGLVFIKEEKNCKSICVEYSTQAKHGPQGIVLFELLTSSNFFLRR